jgi:transaldolase
MSTNPLITLGRLGQSPWYDFITRDLVKSGELARLIAEDGLMGMTSNPTIFEKAVAGSDHYDDDIRTYAAEGRTPARIFEALAVADVRGACDAFLPLHQRTAGVDGLVSLEVSPTLANDTQATILEAERLWKAVDRPNAMIKIPGTLEGLPAITHCLAAGINVNVTLLDKAGDPRRLRGTAAIANACMAYGAFERGFSGARWEALQRKGAQPQRPLWASTSTKDPKLPDVYYVEALIAPQTVNTLPPATFAAYRDHGKPAVRIREGMARAPEQLAGLAASGVDLAAVTATLEREGVASFAASYASLLAGIETKAGALAAAR